MFKGYLRSCTGDMIMTECVSKLLDLVAQRAITGMTVTNQDMLDTVPRETNTGRETGLPTTNDYDVWHPYPPGGVVTKDPSVSIRNSI